MNLPYSPHLKITSLNRIFSNTSECYKFFWFQAIVTKVLEGRDSVSYEELLNEMIADAWYMVTEYHLNLGPRDTLEVLVHEIQELSGMKSAEKRQVVLDYLQTCEDKNVLKRKRTLIIEVPYRLQAPFLEDFKSKDWDVSARIRIEKMNRYKHLFYYYDSFAGLQTCIHMSEEWLKYIRANGEIVKGWLQYHMILYLQKRNPSVPGIADKLRPPQERKLEKVKQYWKLLIELQPVKEIYGHYELRKADISIDHFVPWSYVAHDEFWNLHPTTRAINSSKSNHLPEWDRYFPELCTLAYFSYEMMWEYEAVRASFERCAREHLNNTDVRRRIYRQGLSKKEFSGSLEEVLQPVYQSARNCGFPSWVYTGEMAEHAKDNRLL